MSIAEMIRLGIVGTYWEYAVKTTISKLEKEEAGEVGAMVFSTLPLKLSCFVFVLKFSE